MQDVTQRKLKRQELKKWAVVVAVLVLAFSFLLGAVLISTNTVGKAHAATGEIEEISCTANPASRRMVADKALITVEGSYVDGYKTNPDIIFRAYPVAITDPNDDNEYEYMLGETEHTGCYANVDDKGNYWVSGWSSSTGNWHLLKVYGVAVVTSVSLPETPAAPEGQHFVGWYYDEALTTAYKDGDVITADTALYAKFAVNAYTVTYMVNGTQYSTSELEHGAAITNVAPTGVTAGKQFSGWFTDAACTTAYDFTTGNAISGDITLYGNIETIMLTVTFYVGTEVYTTLEVPYGSTLVQLAQSNATAAAVLRVFNFSEDSQINAEIKITDDVQAFGTLDEKTVNWINTGAWFDANWPWLVACVGVVIIIVVGGVILAKKRR